MQIYAVFSRCVTGLFSANAWILFA